MAPFSALFACFSRFPLSFSHGKGAWLFTQKQEAYLDLTSGIGVNALGHNHPHLVRCLQEQAQKVWHISNLFENPLQEALATRLCEKSFAERVFFTNSGAEAVECAIKTARRYHWSKNNQTEGEIITFEGAFHGRTLATLAAGGQQKYLEGFGPQIPGFRQVPFEAPDPLLALKPGHTAAVLLEPIQGEGGVRPFSSSYLKHLRALCDKTGALLIFDEVQTGIGRTGKLFAYEWSGVAPDILTTAKGLGGGFPIGACLASETVAQVMGPGTHGSTFGGNPLAMAVSNAVLDCILEPQFLEEIQEKSLFLQQGLHKLVQTFPELLAEVRGSGLLLGLRCHHAPLALIQACHAQHLLVLSAGNNVLRFLPPLNITKEELSLALEKLEAALLMLKTPQGRPL